MFATSVDTEDTIVARATAPGGAPRGVVRLSGSQSLDCLSKLLDDNARKRLPRRAARSLRTRLRLPDMESPTPATILVWPNRQSYTRQPSVEIHTTGSPALLDHLVESICRLGARVAEPGEFTLRAFLAGRLDLTQAEAVLAVIDATNQSELNAALHQMAGGLTTPLHHFREELLDLLAHLEAGLDFIDEDIEFITPEQLRDGIASVERRVYDLQSQLASQGLKQELPVVVLCGPPNAGKSSLFNALLETDSALVSPIEGATRDYVVAEWSPTPGRRCQLVDTAGHNDEAANADALAQQLSQAQVHEAAIRIFCSDQHGKRPVGARETDLIVRTKCDGRDPTYDDRDALAVSAHTGFGLSLLRSAVTERLESVKPGAWEGAAARCGASLGQIVARLAEARNAATNQLGEELVAAELRLALDELGRIVGTIYNDDVLDRVFSRFCIGK